MTITFPIKIHNEDYLPDSMVDDEQMFLIKDAIQKLKPVERKIFLTYCEGGTYTAVAKTYNVSVPTAKRYILEVISRIIQMINDNDDNKPTADSADSDARIR